VAVSLYRKPAEKTIEEMLTPSWRERAKLWRDGMTYEKYTKFCIAAVGTGFALWLAFAAVWVTYKEVHEYGRPKPECVCK
jgi:hypothetical protein